MWKASALRALSAKHVFFGAPFALHPRKSSSSIKAHAAARLQVVKQCMVVGQDKRVLGALVAPDEDALATRFEVRPASPCPFVNVLVVGHATAG